MFRADGHETAGGWNFPLIVKSLTQEASISISQASVVDSDEPERACSSSTTASAPPPSSSSTSRGVSCIGIGNQTLIALPVWGSISEHAEGAAHRDRSGEVERE